MLFKKIEEFGNLEMSYLCDFSGGYISRNKSIMDNLDLNKFTQFVLEKCVHGTPIFKLGNKGTRILILSGIHGNELPSQIANLKLLNRMLYKDLNHTLYFIPFASPKSTMNNQRTLNTMDLNRSAHIKDSLSNLIVRAVEDLGINFVGDFHSTSFNSNPGIESVFSSKSPSAESYLIANYISQDIGCTVLSVDFAGSYYKGAVEDVCNLNGIPAITGEVVCPFANVGEGTVERSFAQMVSFLDYFGA
ncbi:succinylglutamate desuccinylase/aspartoacylase family protein [Methanobrevibacter sp.]|uniref:succinylglutamate desuccinylase/aspartoacylase domain-containing protein n=1 Tax=Methanobrevibacter sp. TaxID=66852 RepID=UPI0025F4FF0E|nr:succinylglutamate desuccinylase/aspartoacylase family protein [Methanobrevibacter sp.]MBQ2665718.1 succinylglutamate desuccinylase/aspartoacylase family protein [Methanobrevibacter sp.]